MQMMQVRWSLESAQGKRKSTATDYVHPSKRKRKPVKGEQPDQLDERVGAPVLAVPTSATAAYYAMALAAQQPTQQQSTPQMPHPTAPTASLAGALAPSGAGSPQATTPEHLLQPARPGAFPAPSPSPTTALSEPNVSSRADGVGCNSDGGGPSTPTPLPCVELTLLVEGGGTDRDTFEDLDCLDLLHTVAEVPQPENVKRLEEVVAADIASAVDAEIASWHGGQPKDNGSDTSKSTQPIADDLPELETPELETPELESPGLFDGCSSSDDAGDFEGLDCLELFRTVDDTQQKQLEPVSLTDGSSLSHNSFDILDPNDWFELSLGDDVTREHMSSLLDGSDADAAFAEKKDGGKKPVAKKCTDKPKQRRASSTQKPKLTWHLSHLM